MAGLMVAVNGKSLASVSDEGLNIIAVQVHGDVVGEELAVIEVFGGLYGQGDADKHLIWIADHELSQDDEVGITFFEEISTSHKGKTIEELHPNSISNAKSGQTMDDLFEEISALPKVRERFTFVLVPPEGEMVRTSTGPEDYSFHLTAMWRWIKPSEARVSLTSNTLEKISKRESGSDHAAFALQFGQSVKLRIGT